MSAWFSINSGHLPRPELTVLIWNRVREQPEVAFLDPDDNAWKSQVDGAELEISQITHWAFVQGPTGGAS